MERSAAGLCSEASYRICGVTVFMCSTFSDSVKRLATGWTVRGSNTGGGEIFRNFPDRLWGPHSLLYNGYRVFPGGKERPECEADPPPLLVPWSRKSRAIPLLPLWAVRPVQSLSACTRVAFTFTLHLTTLSDAEYLYITFNV